MPKLLLLILLTSCSGPYHLKKFNRKLTSLDKYIERNEQKEIEEAYREGGVRVACDILDNNKNTPTPQDYFKTTYKNESK